MTQTQAVQTKQPDAPTTIGGWLNSKLPEIEKVLAKSIEPERFMRIVLNAVTKTPSLLECNRSSLWLAILQSAAVGLEPDGTHAALVPYKGQVQFQFMYRGLIRKAREAGEVADVHAQLVYANDEFDWQGGTDPKVEHRPAALGKRGAITGVYAVAFFKDPHRKPMVEVMDVEQVEHCRKSAQTDKVWTQHWGEQAKKTVTKRICKYLPLDPVTQEAISNDDAQEFGPANAEVLDDGSQRPKTVEQLTERLRAELASPGPPAEALKSPDPASIVIEGAIVPTKDGGAVYVTLEDQADPFAEPAPEVAAQAQPEAQAAPLDPANPEGFAHRMRLGLMPQAWEAWKDEHVFSGMLKGYTAAQVLEGSQGGKRHKCLVSAVNWARNHHSPETMPAAHVFGDYCLAFMEERWAREAGQ